MNWGVKIVIAFISFVAIIISMVVISMRQNINLVAQDYYVQEIAYQKQMDRVKNHLNLGQDGLEINLNPTSNFLEIEFDRSTTPKGTVHFFRPSDAKLDRSYPLVLSNGRQTFNKANFTKGLWKIKVNWMEAGKEYYYEKTVVL